MRLAHDPPAVMPGTHAAATLVLMREGSGQPEVLMVRRHAQLKFHGGAWAFPGGRIDPADYDSADPPFPPEAPRRAEAREQARSSGNPVIDAAGRAVVREASEEAGVRVAREDLLLFSRWVTPEGLPRRFDTWFFAARHRGGEVTVDGVEIDDFCWRSAADALAAQARGEIDLPPPTFVTLSGLVSYRCVDTALEVLRRVPAWLFVPRMCLVVGGACTLYEGDAGYEDGEPDRPGARHRLTMLESGWRYECSPELVR